MTWHAVLLAVFLSGSVWLVRWSPDAQWEPALSSGEDVVGVDTAREDDSGLFGKREGTNGIPPN